MPEDTRRSRVRTTDGLGLAVTDQGAVDSPVIIAVHGYPDNSSVWDAVAKRLADEFRVVSYDVRGSGESDSPADRRGYLIPQLNADLAAVMDAVSPDRPVHLVTHDWGSVQTWDAVSGNIPADRIGSFTSISGPSVDHATVWLRDVAGHGVAGARQRLTQLIESSYILFFQTPRLPELMWRSGLFSRVLPRAHTADGINGLELYRANIPRRPRTPRPRRVRVPVQVVVPTRDIFVSAALASQAPAPYVDDLTVLQVDGGHWVVTEQPDLIADLLRRFVTRHERS